MKSTYLPQVSLTLSENVLCVIERPCSRDALRVRGNRRAAPGHDVRDDDFRRPRIFVPGEPRRFDDGDVAALRAHGYLRGILQRKVRGAVVVDRSIHTTRAYRICARFEDFNFY